MIYIENAKQLSSKFAKDCAKSKAEMLQIDAMLNTIWYSNHTPDTTMHPLNIAYKFDIYDHPQYVNNLDVCFKYYTRLNVITALRFFNDLNITPSTILDLYAGDGRSSALLATAFPTSKIYYHQTAIAQINSAKNLFALLNLRNIEHVDNIVPSNTVFAFECFEHFLQPHSLFDKLSDMQYLIENSSFGVKAPGHFYRYVGYDDNIYTDKAIKNNFYKYMRLKNMHAVHRKNNFMYPRFFNGTPCVHAKCV